MPSERLRLQFLEKVPVLQRVDDRTRWSLAYTGEEEAAAASSTMPAEAHGRFYVVREGSALVSSMAALEGCRVDADGLTRDETGARVAIDPMTGGRVIGRLEVGDFFGDTALLPPAWRGATVRAATTGMQLVAWDALELHRTLAPQVLRFDDLRAEFARRDGHVDVRRLGLFNDLPMHDLEAVLTCARSERFTPGEAVVSQGDAGDRFYVLLSGRAVVVVDDEPVAWLEQGDYFGELALLVDVPRTATVRSTDVTECWSIGRDAFERVLRHRLLDATDAVIRGIRAGQGPASPTGSTLAARLRAAR